jgi:hypothetical protein
MEQQTKKQTAVDFAVEKLEKLINYFLRKSF